VLPAAPAARTISDTGRWSYYGELAITSVPPPEFLAAVSNWNWDGEPASVHPLSPSAWWRFWLIVNAGMTVVGGHITGATDASPIEFTTSANHGLSTGATVYIDQVAGNLAANGGPYTIVVDSATTFHVVGLNGTGAYTSGGYVYVPDAQNWAVPFPCLDAPTAPALDSDPNSSLEFLNVPPGFWAGLRALMHVAKAGHAYLANIIVTYDAGLFLEDSPLGATQPDGTFQWPAKLVVAAGSGVYVPARYTNAAYCDGTL